MAGPARPSPCGARCSCPAAAALALCLLVLAAAPGGTRAEIQSNCRYDAPDGCMVVLTTIPPATNLTRDACITFVSDHTSQEPGTCIQAVVLRKKENTTEISLDMCLVRVKGINCSTMEPWLGFVESPPPPSIAYAPPNFPIVPGQCGSQGILQINERNVQLPPCQAPPVQNPPPSPPRGAIPPGGFTTAVPGSGAAAMSAIGALGMVGLTLLAMLG